MNHPGSSDGSSIDSFSQGEEDPDDPNSAAFFFVGYEDFRSTIFRSRSPTRYEYPPLSSHLFSELQLAYEPLSHRRSPEPRSPIAFDNLSSTEVTRAIPTVARRDSENFAGDLLIHRPRGSYLNGQPERWRGRRRRSADTSSVFSEIMGLRLAGAPNRGTSSETSSDFSEIMGLELAGAPNRGTSSETSSFFSEIMGLELAGAPNRGTSSENATSTTYTTPDHLSSTEARGPPENDASDTSVTDDLRRASRELQRRRRHLSRYSLYRPAFQENGPNFSNSCLSVEEQKEYLSKRRDYYKGLLVTVEDTEDTECSICLEKEGVLKALPCKHVSHEECVLTWFVDGAKDTCPVCRKKYNAPSRQDLLFYRQPF